MGSDIERARKNQQSEIEFLNEIGFEAEALDLKDYFHQEDKLRKKLDDLGALWVAGGKYFRVENGNEH